jgi:hypothetical protein
MIGILFGMDFLRFMACRYIAAALLKPQAQAGRINTANSVICLTSRPTNDLGKFTHQTGIWLSNRFKQLLNRKVHFATIGPTGKEMLIITTVAVRLARVTLHSRSAPTLKSPYDNTLCVKRITDTHANSSTRPTKLYCYPRCKHYKHCARMILQKLNSIA